MQMMLIAKPSFLDTPIADGIALKIKAFVSWNKRNHFLPSSTHL
jgi:Holliday junction resolvase RusA-like endonuclease